MTIGIGAAGPRAGLAIFRALEAAERVSTGAIGGFAGFAAIDGEGKLHWAETQRGGTATLFTRGESVGGAPPEAVANAPLAALISSGPDRPAPLSQFLAADPAVGLVTGHRLPNSVGANGIALNSAVLGAMSGGAGAGAALEAVLGEARDADAGMIALGRGRGIAALNSPLVALRPDLGAVSLSEGAARVEILHNAITPRLYLAPLIGELAIGIMAPAPEPAGVVTVRSGTPLRKAAAKRILAGSDGVATAIETDVDQYLYGRHNCAAVYLGTPVEMTGRLVGTTAMEPNVIVEDGRVVSLSGQTTVDIPLVSPSS
ncbi:MAG: hypothetical protein AcusKO_11070 [Acuticoccus sp.]